MWKNKQAAFHAKSSPCCAHRPPSCALLKTWTTICSRMSKVKLNNVLLLHMVLLPSVSFWSRAGLESESVCEHTCPLWWQNELPRGTFCKESNSSRPNLGLRKGRAGARKPPAAPVSAPGGSQVSRLPPFLLQAPDKSLCQAHRSSWDHEWQNTYSVWFSDCLPTEQSLNEALPTVHLISNVFSN